MIPRIAHAVRRRLATVTSADAGFSLIEVVVSFVLFSIVAGGATYGIVMRSCLAHSQQRVDAASVAQSFIASTENSTSLVQVETPNSSLPLSELRPASPQLGD